MSLPAIPFPKQLVPKAVPRLTAADFVLPKPLKDTPPARRKKVTKKVAGKVTEIGYNDAEKNFPISIKVVDPLEKTHCEEGDYTGISIGGDYQGINLHRAGVIGGGHLDQLDQGRSHVPLRGA